MGVRPRVKTLALIQNCTSIVCTVSTFPVSSSPREYVNRKLKFSCDAWLKLLNQFLYFRYAWLAWKFLLKALKIFQKKTTIY